MLWKTIMEEVDLFTWKTKASAQVLLEKNIGFYLSIKLQKQRHVISFKIQRVLNSGFTCIWNVKLCDDLIWCMYLSQLSPGWATQLFSRTWIKLFITVCRTDLVVNVQALFWPATLFVINSSESASPPRVWIFIYKSCSNNEEIYKTLTRFF